MNTKNPSLLSVSLLYLIFSVLVFALTHFVGVKAVAVCGFAVWVLLAAWDALGVGCSSGVNKQERKG